MEKCAQIGESLAFLKLNELLSLPFAYLVLFYFQASRESLNSSKVSMHWENSPSAINPGFGALHENYLVLQNLETGRDHDF